MLTIRKVTPLALLLALAVTVQAKIDPHWTYEGQAGPEQKALKKRNNRPVQPLHGRVIIE